jgi:peptide/nickel transport system permease protein
VTVFVVRRVVLGVLVLAVLSFASFLFFGWQDPQLQGHSLLDAYRTWAAGLFGGDTMYAFRNLVFVRLNQHSTSTLDALGHTAVLLGYALVLVLVLSTVLAVAAATRRGSAFDLLLRGLGYLAWAVPAFLLALLVQLFAFRAGGSRGIGPFPIAGWPGSCPAGLGVNGGVLTPCDPAGSGVHYALAVLRYTTLPAVTLALGFVGLHARYLRGSLVDALGEPYVTTARAKGLSETRVVLRHALRASLVTFVAAVLADVGAIFGGAMAVDWVFEMNGLGTVFVSAFPVDIGSVDTYVIEPVILLTGALLVVSSIVSELVVFSLDPRARAAG